MSEDTKTTDPNSNGGDCLPGGATQPCPCRCGETKWLDTSAYCGDNVRISAELIGGCPDGPATVEILNGGTTVATVNATLSGGHVSAVWVAKAPSADWRTVKLTFRVSAAGQTCASSNEFTFKQRPTTAWALMSVAHASGNGYGPSHEKHDGQLEADRVHYKIKLKTHGRAFPDAKKTAAQTLIQDTWNNGFGARKFHRTGCQRGVACDCSFDCCKCGWRLDVEFVASGEHVDVEIRAGPASSGMNGDGGHWADPPRFTLSYPHEIGHCLGQADEYSNGATDPTGVQPHSPGGTPTLMGDKSAPLLNRHFRWVLKYLNDRAGGDTYETIPR